MADLNKIAVDEKALAKAFGLEEWPECMPLHTFTWQRRMAARAITDSALGPHSTTPADRLSNAQSWINHAYQEGVDFGKRIERASWQAKIRTLFGLDT